MRNPAATLLRTADVVARLGDSPAAFAPLPKQDLLDALHAIADLRQCCDTFSAWIAGELNRRSMPDLGSAGLAQQEGYRTPQAMVEAITGRVTSKKTRTGRAPRSIAASSRLSSMSARRDCTTTVT